MLRTLAILVAEVQPQETWQAEKSVLLDTFRIGLSRQAVYDNIKRTVQILEDYEEKLHIYGDFLTRNHQTDRLTNYVKKNYPQDETLLKLIDNLESIEAE